jgi:hypothetical protein
MIDAAPAGTGMLVTMLGPPAPLPPGGGGGGGGGDGGGGGGGGLPTMTVELVEVVTPFVLVDEDDERVQPGHSIPRTWPAVTASNCASLSLSDAQAPLITNGRLAKQMTSFSFMEPLP